jgi:pyruvate dehydrogenase E2 component (dihydrolipoamide acetyltransferase)
VTVPIEVIMPAMEMNQKSAGLVRWLKEPGSYVMAGEPLMEVETDKVTVEIEALGDGVLTDMRFGPGDEVPVGAVVALLVPKGQ